MSERSLHTAVMQALADAPHVRPDEISAQVVGDDVTLHGTVGSLLQSDEAGSAAHNVPGVRHVDNQLRVRLLGYDRREDADIQAAILDALFADPELHAASRDAARSATERRRCAATSSPTRSAGEPRRSRLARRA